LYESLLLQVRYVIDFYFYDEKAGTPEVGLRQKYQPVPGASCPSGPIDVLQLEVPNCPTCNCVLRTHHYQWWHCVQAFEIVARPALDSMDAALDRVKMSIYTQFAAWGLPCPITGQDGKIGAAALQQQSSPASQ
jgi:cytochrome c heme-lyase